MSFMGLATALYQSIEAKTASFAMVAEDAGKLFTNRGASGDVTFTLPVTAKLPVGWWCEVFNADLTSDLLVAAPAVDTMVVFNDIAADSIAFSTDSEKAGAGARFVWDGTGWLTFVNLGMDSQTPVIAT